MSLKTLIPVAAACLSLGACGFVFKNPVTGGGGVESGNSAGGGAGGSGGSGGASATLAFAVQPGVPGVASTALGTQPVVQLSGSTGSVAVTLAAFTDSGCTVPAGSVFTATTNPVSTSGGTAGFANLTFTATGTYYLQASAPGLSSVCSTAVEVCPAGYALVPHDTTFTTADFCISKYLPSKSGSVAVSVSGALPWVSITPPAATTACQANGAGYDLITNEQWQTAARNLESVGANWSGGTVGSAGGLSQGLRNSQGAQAASADDTQGCIDTGDTCSNTVWDQQRRTMTLSNGQVVWDMAGNVWRWVKDSVTTDFGSDGYLSEITAGTNPASGTVGTITGDANLLFGPAGNYSALTSTPFGGLGYAFLGSPGGSICRGCDSITTDSAGIFAVQLASGTGYSAANVSFRCAFNNP